MFIMAKRSTCHHIYLGFKLSYLIPEKSGNRVHLMYLNLLRDFDNIKKYSWGSACLANLYRELCRASLEVGSVMGGCDILL